MRLDTLPNLNLDPCRVEFLGPLREILESTLTPPSRISQTTENASPPQVHAP